MYIILKFVEVLLNKTVYCQRVAGNLKW